jgi:hypothetical protein
MVGAVRFERTTSAVRTRRSDWLSYAPKSHGLPARPVRGHPTTMAHRSPIARRTHRTGRSSWGDRPGSNRQPPQSQCGALPIELRSPSFRGQQKTPPSGSPEAGSVGSCVGTCRAVLRSPALRPSLGHAGSRPAARRRGAGLWTRLRRPQLSPSPTLASMSLARTWPYSDLLVPKRRRVCNEMCGLRQLSAHMSRLRIDLNRRAERRRFVLSAWRRR